MLYDVIIAGAGPAGAMAAYWLGRAGRRVLILEKARLPRYKTCGGAIPLSYLRSLPFDASPVVETIARQMRYSLADYRDVTQSLPDPGIGMVMRERFDAFLLAQTQAEVRAGVAVAAVQEDDSGVSVAASNGDTVRGRYLIGADGANSTVARCLGLRRRPMLAGALEAEVSVPGPLLEQRRSIVEIRFGAVPYGYSWVFAKGDHLSVGAAALRRGPFEIRSALNRELKRLGSSDAGSKAHGHVIPVYWRHERLHSARSLLVGDAAGLADGLIGEGIRYAMRSGRLAAEAIFAGDVSSYSARIHRSLGSHLGWGRWCGWLLHHTVRATFDRVVINPRLTQTMAAILAGRRSYRDLLVVFPAIFGESLLRGMHAARAG